MIDLKYPKVSIITVCYNSESSILSTLESVNQQSWNNIEHIIVDGGSEDKTKEIIQSYGERISIIISEKDNGIYHAMNKGIDLSNGDVIGFLNSDDFFCHSEVIEEYAEAFQQDNNLEACYGDVSYIARDVIKEVKVIRKWETGEFTQKSFSRGWVPPHPSFYVKKSVFAKLGKFNEDFRYAADFDLICRFLSNGIKSKYLPKNKVFMRVGGATNKSWRNIYLGNKEIISSLSKNNIKIGFNFFISKFISKIKQYF